MFNLSVVVPTPSVTITAPNTQTVGQSLTLTCNVTTVRGITSRVDTVWTRNNVNLRTVTDISATTMHTLVTYIDYYTISSLSISDDGSGYECRLVVHTSPVIIVNDTIRLDVTGEFHLLYIC